MLEFKHPTMATSLSALEFLRASTRPKPSSFQTESKSVDSKRAPSKDQRAKGIAAACILPTVIFLGTEMFTPTEKEPADKPSIEVPEIIITLDADDQKAAELPAS